MYYPFRTLLVGAFMLVTGYPARANLITNGSFETPIVTSPSQFLNMVAGSEPTGFGWNITSGEVDNVIRGSIFAATAFDGIQFLDLDGFVPGAIAQNFATTPGGTYVLRFAYANNPHGGGANCVPPTTNPCATIPASGTVAVFDASTAIHLIAPLLLTHGNSTIANPNWTPSETIVFVAEGAMTTLSFVSNNPNNSNGGIFLDAVSVVVIPEPGSFVMLLIGLAAVGTLYLWRRPRDRTI